MSLGKNPSLQRFVLGEVTLFKQDIRLEPRGVHDVPDMGTGALLGLNPRNQRRPRRAIKIRLDERILFFQRRQNILRIGNRNAGIKNQLAFLARAVDHIFALRIDGVRHSHKNQSESSKKSPDRPAEVVVWHRSLPVPAVFGFFTALRATTSFHHEAKGSLKTIRLTISRVSNRADQRISQRHRF